MASKAHRSRSRSPGLLLPRPSRFPAQLPTPSSSSRRRPESPEKDLKIDPGNAPVLAYIKQRSIPFATLAGPASDLLTSWICRNPYLTDAGKLSMRQSDADYCCRIKSVTGLADLGSDTMLCTMIDRRLAIMTIAAMASSEAKAEGERKTCSAFGNSPVAWILEQPEVVDVANVMDKLADPCIVAKMMETVKTMVLHQKNTTHSLQP